MLSRGRKKILHKVLSLAGELSDHYGSTKLPVNVDRICIIYNFFMAMPFLCSRTYLIIIIMKIYGMGGKERRNLVMQCCLCLIFIGRRDCEEIKWG
jgi:hypothetical protein